MIKNLIENPTQECLREAIQTIPWLSQQTGIAEIKFSAKGFDRPTCVDDVETMEQYRKDCLKNGIAPFFDVSIFYRDSDNKFVLSNGNVGYGGYSTSRSLTPNFKDFTKPGIVSVIDCQIDDLQKSEPRIALNELVDDLAQKNYHISRLSLFPWRLSTGTYLQNFQIGLTYNHPCMPDGAQKKLSLCSQDINQFKNYADWFEELKLKYQRND